MATIIKLKNENELVTVKVNVTGFNEWALTYYTAFNGKHKRHSKSIEGIILGLGKEKDASIDNWKFKIDGVNDDTSMSLKWYQGKTKIGQWSKKGKTGTAIYYGDCEYKNKML